ncbi:glycosyltransferase family 2 protein [Chryseobacterium koreense]|uniref:Glycosyl transferase family 2 n=1 Tax=Chryseobacterium koreense CCUG 49689 TaxID=1304281 RepID=A0A0J7IXJ6_9FLAO|nr:glycosyltransferase family 2 protein [Chryseobacterium koreense]KMQ70551.1 glycosyl transferase family 2 [Chryseobacterium koreense CCUG 49689]MBB5334351.1 glycosyltransferase involved in cell wall biosynthesis [Chryseobacterium koreense]
MKFLIIIPAHNEEKNIFFCLESLKNQTFRDFQVIVINDGSTDKTAEIVENFKLQTSNFQLKTLEKSSHEPGAKVVQTFNKGLEMADLKDFEVICKFDADIIFPKNYLEKVNQIYLENPKAGMVSGLVRIKKSVFEKNLAFDFKDEKRQWTFENLSSKNHVRGPIKSYRKECFLQMKGLRAVLGWDNIDVMLAKKNGWEIVTIKDLWVKHLRPTAFKYKKQKAEKLGEYFYNIGLSFPLAIISSAKSALKNKSFSEFLTTMKIFLKQKGERKLSKEEIKYIRNLRWKQMLRQ